MQESRGSVLQTPHSTTIADGVMVAEGGPDPDLGIGSADLY